MNIGLLMCFRNPPRWAVPFERLYAEYLDDVTLAENLGFDSVWLSEHHFAEDGYSPSLLPIAGAIAARTTKIRIGTALLLLPLHNAIRIAEDAATLDILSNGRFDLGIGLGFGVKEFAAYGVSRADRGTLMEEGIQVLQGLWRQKAFSFTGKHYKLSDVELAPRPVQEGGPPIWVGAAAPKAIDRAARFGCGLVPAHERAQVIFDNAIRESGREPTDFGAAQLKFCHVAETDDQAWENSQDHLHYMQTWYDYWFDEAGDGPKRPPLPPAEKLREQPDRVLGGALVGSPETVAKEIIALKSRSRVTHMILGMHLPGLAPDKIRSSMRKFIEAVRPAIGV